MTKEKYNIGQQPCKNFNPMDEGFGGVQPHDCYCGHSLGKGCPKTVAFCSNCSTDHHENGYENCVCKGKGFNQ